LIVIYIDVKSTYDSENRENNKNIALKNYIVDEKK